MNIKTTKYINIGNEDKLSSLASNIFIYLKKKKKRENQTLKN